MSNESFHIVAPLDQIAICVIDRLFYLRVQVRDLHRDAFRFIPIGKIRNVFFIASYELRSRECSPSSTSPR